MSSIKLKNILFLAKQVSVYQLSNQSTPIYNFLHEVSHTEQHFMSTERNNNLYGLWQAIMSVWHHQLISLMPCQYKQRELIISGRRETWEDTHIGGRTQGMEMCEGCSSVRGTWQMGLSLPMPCDLSYKHIHAAAVFLLPLTSPEQSVPLVFALPFCLTTTQVSIHNWWTSILLWCFLASSPALLSHFPSLLSFRRHPPGLLSHPVTCPSMYQNTHMTSRRLMWKSVVICLLSLELGGSSTAGTNYVPTSLSFCLAGC